MICGEEPKLRSCCRSNFLHMSFFSLFLAFRNSLQPFVFKHPMFLSLWQFLNTRSCCSSWFMLHSQPSFDADISAGVDIDCCFSTASDPQRTVWLCVKEILVCPYTSLLCRMVFYVIFQSLNEVKTTSSQSFTFYDR
jgi:hypothetical protein